jgi:hypothetical protein
MSFRPWTTLGIAIGLLQLAAIAPASADPISPLFRSEIAETLLETRPGAALMREVLGLRRGAEPELESFLLRLHESTPAMRIARSDLEAALQNSKELLEEYRAGRAPERLALGDEAPLTSDEVEFLSELAAREFRLNPRWSAVASRDPEPGSIEFVPRARSTSSVRERFLLGESKDTLRPSVLEELRGARRAKGFLSKMAECVRNRPPSQAKRDRIRYMLTQMGISGIQTTIGFVTASCSKVIDWKNLSSDLLTSVISSGISSQIMTGKATRFLVRMMRVTTYNQARAAVDGVYYYFTPLKDTYGQPVAEATRERYLFNAAWGASSPLINVSVYNLVTGLECIAPGAKMTMLSTGIRFAASMGTSFTYFRLRNRFTGRDALADCNQ